MKPMLSWVLEPEKVEAMFCLREGKKLSGGQWDAAVGLIKADLAVLDHFGDVILSWEGEMAVSAMSKMDVQPGRPVHVSFSKEEYAEYVNSRI